MFGLHVRKSLASKQLEKRELETPATVSRQRYGGWKEIGQGT